MTNPHKLRILLDGEGPNNLDLRSNLQRAMPENVEIEYLESNRSISLLGLIQRKSADLVILSSGPALTREIRAANPNALVVFISSSDDESAMSEAVERFGVDRCLRRWSLSYEELAWVGRQALLSRLHRDGGLVERRYQFITQNSAATEILKRADAIQPDQNVLIFGETGTGKELIARRIHASAKVFEPKRPLKILDCSSLSTTLFEGEVFGHKKGSFTGAVFDRPGALQMANGGDLFLDEIHNISISLQQKLLRVLNDGVFSPVGSNEEIKSKFRIIAATNIPIDEAIASGKLLPDFVSRIQKRKIELPSLKQRKDDIPVLAEAYLSTVKTFDKEFSEDAFRFIAESDLKMNIRGLYSILDTALAEVKVPIIRAAHLRRFIPTAALKKDTINEPDPSEEIEAVVKTILSKKGSIAHVLDQIEKRYLACARVRYRSAREFAAGEGYNRSTLLRKLNAFGIA